MAPDQPSVLPEKASALLRLAVADCRKVAKLKTRRLYMWQWHQPTQIDGDEVCEVCMAGAIMDRTLKLDPRKTYTPGAVARLVGDETITGKLCRIDQMRKGYNTGDALAGALISDHYNPRLGRAPWRIYLRAAAMLERRGL